MHGLLSFRGLPDIEEALREENRQLGATVDSVLDAVIRSAKSTEQVGETLSTLNCQQIRMCGCHVPRPNSRISTVFLGYSYCCIQV